MKRNSRQTKLGEVLYSPDKGASKTYGIKGVLANAFRNLLAHLNVEYSQWSVMLDDYIRRIGRQRDSKKAISGIRGNLTKALYNPEMSWLTFCKGLSFLKVRKFRITLDVEYLDGTTSKHEFQEVILEESMEFDEND